jgi:hypothetical protein
MFRRGIPKSKIPDLSPITPITRLSEVTVPRRNFIKHSLRPLSGTPVPEKEPSSWPRQFSDGLEAARRRMFGPTAVRGSLEPSKEGNSRHLSGFNLSDNRCIWLLMKRDTASLAFNNPILLEGVNVAFDLVSVSPETLGEEIDIRLPMLLQVLNNRAMWRKAYWVH